MNQVADFQTALANAVGGVGRAQEITFKGKTLPANFDEFVVRFRGTGASTAFNRTLDRDEWSIEGVINLPVLDHRAELTDTFVSHAKGFLVHEQLHVHLTDFDAYQAITAKTEQVHREQQLKVSKDQFAEWVGGACNGAEDVRIEMLNLRGQIFVGAIPNLVAIMNHHIADSYEQGYNPACPSAVSWTIKILGLAKLAHYPLIKVEETRKVLASNPKLERAIDNIIDAIDSSNYDEHGIDIWNVVLAQLAKFAQPNVDSPTPPSNPSQDTEDGQGGQDTDASEDGQDEGEGNGDGADGKGEQDDEGIGEKGEGDADGDGEGEGSSEGEDGAEGDGQGSNGNEPKTSLGKGEDGQSEQSDTPANDGTDADDGELELDSSELRKYDDVVENSLRDQADEANKKAGHDCMAPQVFTDFKQESVDVWEFDIV